MSSRAFDILELLIRANGALVSKDEIMQRVWPHTVVEENNLQVHVVALRKALAGDRNLIVTVPRRGYRLLTTTRTYALQQLENNGERAAAALAHANDFHALFRLAPAGGEGLPGESRLHLIRREPEKLRGAEAPGGRVEHE